MPNILIAGAGQLGSRYLQGLAKVADPINIYVQDVSENSLNRAKMRWEEVTRNSLAAHSVIYNLDFDTLPGTIDIAIVATTADVRPGVVSNIASGTNVRFWILEKVLAQTQVGLASLRVVTETSDGAWVNTSRRMMAWHKSIKSMMQKGSSVKLLVEGGNWGLASNAVHFLDLLSWWTGEKLEYIDTSKLEENWTESKRPGYFEISGTLSGHFSNGSMAELSVTNNSAPIVMRVILPLNQWTIHEAQGLALCSDGTTVNGQIDAQSMLTSTLVDELIREGICGLPSFNESARMHGIFLQGLQEHWNRQPDRQKNILPIT